MHAEPRRNEGNDDTVANGHSLFQRLSIAQCRQFLGRAMGRVIGEPVSARTFNALLSVQRTEVSLSVFFPWGKSPDFFFGIALANKTGRI